MNTDKIWDEYGSVVHSETGIRYEVFDRDDLPKIAADILSSQWQTREPTWEDGIEILVEYYDGSYMVVEVLYWSEMGRNFKRWMKIPE